jgi:hypothetical protein
VNRKSEKGRPGKGGNRQEFLKALASDGETLIAIIVTDSKGSIYTSV